MWFAYCLSFSGVNELLAVMLSVLSGCVRMCMWEMEPQSGSLRELFNFLWCVNGCLTEVQCVAVCHSRQDFCIVFTVLMLVLFGS